MSRLYKNIADKKVLKIYKKIIYTDYIGTGKATDIIREREVNMNVKMSETARLILALRERGMSDTEITNLILFVETGEEQYKPKKESKEKKLNRKNRSRVEKG